MKTPQPPVSSFHPGRHFEIFDGAIADPYQQPDKYAEPTICGDCGAVYHEGRWQWTAAPSHAHRSRCPACSRIQEEMPAGYLTIRGKFAKAHRAEILSLARNLEEREKREHPLQRIMNIDQQPDELAVTTTDIHLARGIGEALKHAYHGKLDYHYNPGEYLLRVTWER